MTYGGPGGHRWAVTSWFSRGILKRIKNLRKKVIFISNAPRKSIKIKKFLNKIGLKRNLYFDVVSSGDLTYEDYLIKLKKKNIIL